MPDCSFNILSMGMSSDYAVALEEGGTMVRIGSLLFWSKEEEKASNGNFEFGFVPDLCCYLVNYCI